MSSFLPKELWALNSIDWEPSKHASAQPDAIQAYEAYIRTACDQLDIIGRPNQSLLSTAYIFPQVVAKPSIWQYYKSTPGDLSTLRTEPVVTAIPEQAPVCALTAVLNHDRIAIVGSPGAGTSTFLRFLALQTLNPDVAYKQVPIRIALDQFFEQDIQQHIAAQFAACGFAEPERCVRELLEKGAALLLFDGLDEAGSSSTVRANLLKQVMAFVAQYPTNKVVITNRTTLVDYDLEDFAYYAMHPFEAEQITAYVTQWFTGQPEEAKALSAELNNTTNLRLKALATVPLTLSMLCLVYAETGKIPAERWQLYKFTTDVHFKYQRATQPLRTEKRLSVAQKRQLLTAIAHHTFEANQRLIPKPTLLALVQAYLATQPHSAQYEAALVLQDIVQQPQLLRQVDPHHYAFQHLTFHEYYVGRHIVADETGALPTQLVQHQLTCRMWREVVLFTVEQLANADAFFALFSQRMVEIAENADLTALFVDNAHLADSRRLREHWRVITCRALAVRMVGYLARILSVNTAINVAINLAHDLQLPIEHSIAEILEQDMPLISAKILATVLNNTDQMPGETVERASVLVKARTLDVELAKSISTIQTMDWAFALGAEADICASRQQAEFVAVLTCIWVSLIYSKVDSVTPLIQKLMQESLAIPDLALPGVNWREQLQRMLSLSWDGDLSPTVGKALLELTDDILNMGMPTPIDWQQMNIYFQLSELYLSSISVATVSERKPLLSKLLFPTSD